MLVFAVIGGLCAILWRWERIDVETLKGVRFLVASRGRQKVVLGAQFVEAPETPAFGGWVLQEASLILAPAAETATVVGVGGGFLVNAYRRRGIATTGVDASARVLDLATRHFGVDRDGLVRADGLAYLNSSLPTDLTAIDVFDGSGATWRFLEDDALDILRKKTRELLTFNVVVLDRDSAAPAAAARLATRFAYVRGFRDNDKAAGASNVVLFASQEPLKLDRLARLRAVDDVSWVRKNFVRWEVVRCEDGVCSGATGGLGDAFYDRQVAAELRVASRAHVPDSFPWLELAWAYLVWMWLTDPLKSATAHVPGRPIAEVCRLTFLAIGALFGLRWRFVVEKDLPPPGRAIVCCSPHGTYPIASLFFGIPHFRCKTPRVRAAAASILFYVPVLREYLLVMGAREATKKNLEKLLDADLTIAINPGGLHEMVHASSDQERLFVQKNLGIFKLALRKKARISLVYSFGENQVYETRRTLFAFRAFLVRKCRVGLPWISGRFGLGLGPFPLIPLKTNFVHVFGGDHLDISDLAAAVKPETIDDLAAEVFHQRYKPALLKLFNRHKHLLPPDVAAKGLSITIADDDGL